MTSLQCRGLLDQLLRLDIVHAVHASDTVTAHPSVFICQANCVQWYPCVARVPHGEDTASLGETGLLLHAADSLFQDGGHLGGLGLGLGGIATDEGVGDGGSGALLRAKDMMLARCP